MTEVYRLISVEEKAGLKPCSSLQFAPRVHAASGHGSGPIRNPTLHLERGVQGIRPRL